MEERMAIDHSQQLDHTFGRLPRRLAGAGGARTWLYSWIRRDSLALIIFMLVCCWRLITLYRLAPPLST